MLLGVQVAEEQARSKRLAEKLAAARHALGSTPMHVQLRSAEDGKRKAEQHAEHMRQVWLLSQMTMTFIIMCMRPIEEACHAWPAPGRAVN